VRDQSENSDRAGAGVWGEVKLCLGVLTRIPVSFDREAAPGDLARASRWFPLVGLIFGAVGALVLLCAQWLDFPPTLAAGLCLVVLVFLSGSFHEDGLADVADGFGGGISRDQKLEIMRDSRIGTHGVLALVFSVGLRWVLLSALIAENPERAIYALIVAACLSRLALVLLMKALAPARADGLGAGAGRPDYPSVLVALFLSLAVTLIFQDWRLIAAALAALVLAVAIVARLAWKQIGGQTGDVLGAGQQTAEVLILLAAFMVAQ
jgi:adenosylcobinamide-GDP ribazoletransferase